MHDEPISRDEIIKDLVEEKIYKKAEEYALELFNEGKKWANQQGLILVDTKYEFGIVDGELIGGSDIALEMFESGELQEMIDEGADK